MAELHASTSSDEDIHNFIPMESILRELGVEEVENFEDEDIMNDPAIQRMEPNLLLMLTHFRLSNKIIRKVAASGLKYSQLSGLVKLDLTRFGIYNDELQEEMLNEFRNIQGQDQSFAALLRSYKKYPGMPAMNQMTVIDMIQGQLQSMNTLLAATILKVGVARSSQSPGIVVNNNFNPPNLVVKMLEKMSTHTNEIGELIGQLQDHQLMEKTVAEQKEKHWKRFGMITLFIASGLITGIVIAKNWRGSP